VSYRLRVTTAIPIQLLSVADGEPP